MAQVAGLDLSRSSVSAAANSVSRQSGFCLSRCLVDFDFDSFLSSIPSSLSFLDDYTTSLRFGFDASSEGEDPDFVYEDYDCVPCGSDGDAGGMDLFEDLFEPCQTLVTEELDLGPDLGRDDNSGLFGFGPGVGSNVGLPLELESDEFMMNAGFSDRDYENSARFEANNDDNRSANETGEFGWEEMRDLDNIEDGGIPNFFTDGIEEMLVSSEISSSEIDYSIFVDDEAEEEDCEVESLLTMNALVRSFNQDISVETVEHEAPLRNLLEDYTTAFEEYLALFGRLVENENTAKHRPPAAKSAVENMSMVLTNDETGENVSCPICMDEFLSGEKLTAMPCLHLYHGECISPWLQSRNTCPVCRFELSSDHQIPRTEETILASPSRHSWIHFL